MKQSSTSAALLVPCAQAALRTAIGFAHVQVLTDSVRLVYRDKRRFLNQESIYA